MEVSHTECLAASCRQSWSQSRTPPPACCCTLSWAWIRTPRPEHPRTPSCTPCYTPQHSPPLECLCIVSHRRSRTASDKPRQESERKDNIILRFCKKYYFVCINTSPYCGGAQNLSIGMMHFSTVSVTAVLVQSMQHFFLQLSLQKSSVVGVY